MGAFTLPSLSQPAENRELGKLCDLCTSMFDVNVNWTKGVYRPHHNIRSLSQSAEAGCHICSLILGEISSDDVRQLQHNLDESILAPSQQIGVKIEPRDNENLTLRIARCNDLVRGTREIDLNDWISIGSLLIQFEEDDHTNEVLSAAVSNFSASTIAQITSWLGGCIASHTKCSDIQAITTARHILPTRLLDLRYVAQEGHVRLIVSQSLPQDTIYVTLSHCWGGGCGKTLTVSSLKDFEEGFLLSSLPKTFQDAVYITIKLGAYYLWIDALCIIQDSIDDSDWKHEASIMGDVYANSYFTLAATTSPNSQGGLIHQRNPLSVWPCSLKATWRCFSPGQLLVGTKYWTSDSDMKPLADRAWAFQEWLLSKRLIHFSQDQVRWECYCLAASEVYRDGLDEDDLWVQGTPTKGLLVDLWRNDKVDLVLWRRIREEYSEKVLTKITDKLPAFSGIARMVHKVLNSTEENYLAGLYKPKLLEELLWKRLGDELQPHHPNLYIAPTWSWASLNGAFEMGNEYSDEESLWLAEVLETNILFTSDAFGPVKGGSIVLKCSLCSVTISPPQDANPDRLLMRKGWEILTINGVSVTYPYEISFDHLPTSSSSLSPSPPFHFVPIRSITPQKRRAYTEVAGLLLQRTQLRGQYYRVGVLRYFLDENYDEDFLPLLERQNNSDADCYLQTDSRDLCSIEII